MHYKKIIHISDTHILPHRTKNRDRLRETSQIIAQRFNSRNFIVLITGDIVDGANLKSSIDKEFSRAEEALQPLISKGFDIKTVPGNHDFGYLGIRFQEKNKDRYMKFHKDICGVPAKFPWEIEYKYSDGNIAWVLILIDSCYHVDDRDDRKFAQGRIHVEQREKLRNILSKLKESKYPCVIAFHHDYTLDIDESLKLIDYKEFKEVLDKRESQVTLCFGHRHVQNIGNASGGNRSLRIIRAANMNSGVGKLIKKFWPGASSNSYQYRAILVDPVLQTADTIDVRTYVETPISSDQGGGSAQPAYRDEAQRPAQGKPPARRDEPQRPAQGKPPARRDEPPENDDVENILYSIFKLIIKLIKKLFGKKT